MYREIIAVCSQIHTKHINTLCGQNVELLNVKLAVHIATTGLLWSHSELHGSAGSISFYAGTRPALTRSLGGPCFPSGYCRYNLNITGHC